MVLELEKPLRRLGPGPTGRGSNRVFGTQTKGHSLPLLTEPAAVCAAFAHLPVPCLPFRALQKTQLLFHTAVLQVTEERLLMPNQHHLPSPNPLLNFPFRMKSMVFPFLTLIQTFLNVSQADQGGCWAPHLHCSLSTHSPLVSSPFQGPTSPTLKPDAVCASTV